MTKKSPSGNGFSLVVMAAGLGTRFGGLKQLTPVGPFGEALGDYAIFDAIQAGCTSIVIIVRDEILDIMSAHFDHWKKHVPVTYVLQKPHELPHPMASVAHREKPFGTVHAVWSVRHAIEEKCVVVNADDYYGPESFQTASAHLSGKEHVPALVGYRLKNTVSPYGTVTRGVCASDSSGWLRMIQETEKIALLPNGDIVCPDGTGNRKLSPESEVSMNMWAFSKGDLAGLELQLIHFLKHRGMEPKSEFHLSTAVGEMLKEGAKLRVLPTESEWFGITYVEDMPTVQSRLKERAVKAGQKKAIWEL